MAKEIVFEVDARDRLKKGVDSLANAVKATLGPKGMDKMLVDSMGDVIITNDGVTILKEIEVEHPAAKMVVEVAKTQDSECGDGTTTAVILAGELLKNAEELLDKGVHRGFITYEELSKSLGKRHFSQGNIESAFLHIFDNKVTLVEKKSDYQSTKKREAH